MTWPQLEALHGVQQRRSGALTREDKERLYQAGREAVEREQAERAANGH